MLIIKNISLFDGTSIQKNKTVLVDQETILDIKGIKSHIEHKDHKIQVIEGNDNLLIPGFIDIQVNGGGGAFFNRAPSVNSLKQIFSAHLKYGTTNIFPTFISDSHAQLNKAVDAVEQAVCEKNSGILGLHCEGPFLNKIKKGIHPESHILKNSNEILQSILNAKIPNKIVTLAPEMVEKQYIQKMLKKNIYIFAGHTNARADEMHKYFKSGICGVTHLFNACSQIHSRDVGVVGAALLEPNIMCSLILDGEHVSDDALRISFKVKSHNEFMLISDAMENIGTNVKSFKIFDDLISIKQNKLTNKDGTLAGANLTMLWAFQTLMKKKLVTLSEAICMTSTNQAKHFRLKDKGAILPNYDANMVLLDKNNFELLQVIFLGKLV